MSRIFLSPLPLIILRTLFLYIGVFIFSDVFLFFFFCLSIFISLFFCQNYPPKMAFFFFLFFGSAHSRPKKKGYLTGLSLSPLSRDSPQGDCTIVLFSTMLCQTFFSSTWHFLLKTSNSSGGPLFYLSNYKGYFSFYTCFSVICMNTILMSHCKQFSHFFI